MPKPLPVELPPGSYVADRSRCDPVGRSRAERAHLVRLDEQVAYLDAQIDAPGMPDGPLGHYRARRASLRWVMSRAADAERLEEQVTLDLVEQLARQHGLRLNRIYRPGYELHVEDYETAKSIVLATLRAVGKL